MYSNFTKNELKLLRSLRTPVKVQDYLESLNMNFELKGETCMSPRRVLREKRAHCIEAALLAATALRIHGRPPLLLDLTATEKDFDHVIAPFQQFGKWGAISKSNHTVLRYRDPVYANPRELVMSYFHEYFLDYGEKTLRSYSRPMNLSRFDARGWMTAETDIWYVPEYLVHVRHIQILNSAQQRSLRRADPIELRATDHIIQKLPRRGKN